jgi:GIY-YIG catalytic domain
MISIYALVDPRTLIIRYIGKTVATLKRRCRQHIKEMNRLNTPKNAWIRSLQGQGLSPLIWLVEQCEPSQWEERERLWIRVFKSLPGFLNVSAGGDTGPDQTGFRFSEEARRKVSEKSKQWWLKQGPEYRKFYGSRLMESQNKMSAERRAAWMQKSHDAIKLKLTGTKLTEEHKTRVSQGIRRRWPNGRTHPPETIKVLREKNILNSPIRKPVQCIDTGEVFTSMKAAGRALGIRYRGSNIARAIKMNIKFRKMKWRFV